jgi:hydroxymethylpyrimidine/phosphomethylpyrimidine kinase
VTRPAGPQDAGAPPCLLIIAGNDPSGGAGLCADIQTATALGLHPLPVVTSLTVQDTRNVSAVEDVAPALLREQLACVLADLPVAAVKIGLLGTPALARVVIESLGSLRDVPVVLDPVLKAGGGGRLAGDAMAAVLAGELLPLATIATPNRFELACLAPGAGDTVTAAAALARHSGTAILATGADAATDCGAREVENILVTAGGTERRWRWPRLEGRYHGSGCTLAAALASLLARGRTIERAADEAQRYTARALAGGFRPGGGQHIPRRMVE